MQITNLLINAAHNNHKAGVSIEMYLPLHGSLCSDAKLSLFFFKDVII